MNIKLHLNSEIEKLHSTSLFHAWFNEESSLGGNLKLEGFKTTAAKVLRGFNY
jgi:hypothetical protein